MSLIVKGAQAKFMNALEKVASQNPSGALLPVRDVRKLAGLSKKSFDDTALELSHKRLVILHHHDFPGSASVDVREKWIETGEGWDKVYFHGIALGTGYKRRD